MNETSLMQRLRQYDLLPEKTLEQLARLPEAYNSDPRPLSNVLLKRGLLTRYQLTHIVTGKVEDLLIGPYLLLDKLGEGAIGEVFKAKHRRMDRTVALKRMRKEKLGNAVSVKRFYQEVEAAAQMQHPNLIAAYDAGMAGGIHYFAMEYVAGPDLSRLVKERGALPVRTACDYARQAALGLQHAHDRGLVHRDVKPSNLMVAQSDGVEVVKVLDLGVARLADNSFQQERDLTRLGQVIGTPDYLAPEQAVDSHMADSRSDIYSLGCSLYFLLTARPPFQAHTLAQLLLKHQMQPPTPLRQLRPDVPVALEQLVARMMAKRPEDRPSSAAEVASMLEPFTWNETTSGRAPVPAPPLPPACDETPDTEPDPPLRRQRRKKSPTALLIGIGAAAGSVFLGLIITIAVVAGSGKSSAGRGETPIANKRDRDNQQEKPGKVQPPVIVAKKKEEPGKVQPPVIVPNKKEKPIQVQVPPPSTEPIRGQRYWIPDLGRIGDLCIHPDGQRAYCRSEFQVVELDLEKGEVVGRFPLGKAHVSHLALFPDGKRLLMVNSPSVLSIWDIATGSVIKELEGHQSSIHALAISPDGRYALSSGGGPLWQNGKAVMANGRHVHGDFSVRLWDLQKGKQVGVFPADSDDTFTALAFSPDGKQVWAFDRLPRHNLHVWDVQTKKRLPLPDIAKSSVAGFVLAGKDWALVATQQNTLRRLDLNSKIPPKNFPPHPSSFRAMAASADGKRLVLLTSRTRSATKHTSTLTVYDVESGDMLGHSQMNHSHRFFALSADGKLALLGNDDAGVRIIEVDRILKNPPALPQLPAPRPVAGPRDFAGHKGAVHSVAFSPTGRWLASGGADGTVRLWDVASGMGSIAVTMAAPVRAVRFSRDGLLCMAVGDDPTGIVHDVAGKKPYTTLTLTGRGLGVDGTIDSQYFAFITNSSITFKALNMPNAETYRRFPTPSKSTALVYLSNHTYALGDVSGDINLWTTGSNRPSRSLQTHKGAVHCLAYQTMHGRLFSGGADGMIAMRVVLPGRVGQAARFAGHDSAVVGLSVTPDGTTVASCSKDKTVCVWDSESKQIMRFVEANEPLGVSLSPDGKRLAVCSTRGLRVYDVTVP